MSNVNSKAIIDVHNHFVCKNTIDAFLNVYPKSFTEKFTKNGSEFVKRFEKMVGPEDRATQLVENMKLNGVDQLLPMTFSGDEESGFLAHKKYPKELPGTIPILYPEYHTDPNILEEWRTKGAVAIKFYPAFWSYGFNDERIGPYLDKIRDLGLGVLIHFGVVKGGETRNVWPSNPLELKPWLTNSNSRYEDMKFIICHFGAGYLREILLMAYGFKKNIAVDTSGSNDWIFNSEWTDLNQVFSKTIRALGVENIFFGTDSNFTLLREDVLRRQIGILEDLVTKKIISDDDRWNILGQNTLKQILKK